MPSYRPFWNALFAKPLLKQTVALLQRDQEAAISIVNPSLAPIREFHFGAGMRTALPWLTIAYEGTTFDSYDDLYRFHHPTRISLILDVEQYDQEFALDKGLDYLHVLDIVVTSTPGPDWETALPIQHETVPGGVTTPPLPGTLKRVWVAEHRCGPVSLEEIQAPVLRVTLSIDFELKEPLNLS